MRRYGVAVLMSIAGVLASDASALAQSTTFGGGRLTAVAPTKDYRPTVGMTVQPRAAKLAFRFGTTLLCGRVVYPVTGRAVVDWDGSTYVAEGAFVEKLSGGKLEYAWSVAGTVAGQSSDGVLRIAGKLTLDGKSRTCAKRPVRSFQTRALWDPAGAPGATAPEPGGAYAGLVDSIIADDLPGAVFMRVTADGRRFGARWEAAAACGSGPREIFVNFTPSSAFRPDGSFYRAERFSQRFSNALVRYRVRFSGRLTTLGAWGTLQLRTAVYDRAGRKLRTRCDSGLRRWTAMRVSAAPGSPPAPSR